MLQTGKESCFNKSNKESEVMQDLKTLFIRIMLTMLKAPFRKIYMMNPLKRKMNVQSRPDNSNY